jgi:hypothetical protein
VRRVPDLTKTQIDGQGELFPVWRYHAAFTDSPFVLVQAEQQHRGHAVIEQVFAELIDGPLAHLPSGRFPANNAWLACAAIAHNLTRAAATLAGRRYPTARAATIRRHLINLAARTARHARGIIIHLPQHTHRRHDHPHPTDHGGRAASPSETLRTVGAHRHPAAGKANTPWNTNKITTIRNAHRLNTSVDQG